MIARGISKPVLRRGPDEVRGRLKKISEVTQKIWDHRGPNGFPTLNSLEHAIRKADVTNLPEEIDDDLAICMLMSGRNETLRSYIDRVGHGYLKWMVRHYKEKIQAIFDELKKRQNG